MSELQRVTRDSTNVLTGDPLTTAAPTEAGGSVEREHAGVALAQGLFVLLGLLAIGCWIAIYRWYSLFENRNNTHFAFEKIPGGFGSPVLKRSLLLFLAVSVIYGVGFFLIRKARRISIIGKVGAILLMTGPAVINVLIYPVGALDVFNYMIELKLAYHFDQNPYLVTFANYRADPFALPAFLVDIPLFYGPAWLQLSNLPALFVGYDDWLELLVALKIFNLVLLGLTGLAIYRYQEDSKQGWLAAYLFLANPVVVFEGVGNAHNDVMMTVFLIAALLALKRRSVTAGPLLALSALVKVFSIVLAPLFVLVTFAGKWGKRKLVASALLALAVVVAASAPYWAGGEMLDGLRRGTVASQRMDHASVVSLTQQYAAQIRIAGDESPWLAALTRPRGPDRILSDEEKRPLQRLFAGLFVLLALLIVWAVKRGRELEPAVVDTLMLFALLLTNLYAWYLIPIFAALALKPNRFGLVYLFAATALGLAYYPMYVYAHFNTDWPIFRVHLFLGLFLTLPMLAFLTFEACRLGLRVFVRHGGEKQGAAA